MMKTIISIVVLSLTTLTISCSASHTDNATIKTVTKEFQEKVTVKNVDASEFKKLIEGEEGQILDVRTPKEWSGGVIEGANKINFFDQDFKEQLTKLDKSKPVYVYCKAGGRSGKAAKQLEQMGFTTVYNLVGGIGAWSKENYETVKQ